MMTTVDNGNCGEPMGKPVLGIGKRFCLTWKVTEHFARDQIAPFQADNIEVNITLHYLSPDSTLVNHGVESGWKTINLDELYLLELTADSNASSFSSLPLLTDEAVIVALEIHVEQEEMKSPVPVLMFFQVSVIGAGVDIFASSPLVAFKPESEDPQNSVMSPLVQCTNIIPRLEEAVDNRIPCPATMSQAFLDPSLIIDSGCIVNPTNPNKEFNCYLNPGAKQCFLQR